MLKKCGEMPFFSTKYSNGMKYPEEGGEISAYGKGMAGEEVAVAYLRSEGYRILCRNYRFRRAEIDILALRGRCLVVVEVKTRTEGFLESLSDTVSRAKIRRLVVAADHFVRERGLEVEVRFDIIRVYGQAGAYRLDHLPDAFYHF